jgi:hypothetical protein
MSGAVNTYGITYKEGARGSFIGDLACLMLSDDTKTIIKILDMHGDAGFICRSWMQIHSDKDADFILQVGYDTDSLVQDPKAKSIFILYDDRDLKTIELIKLFKSDNLGEHARSFSTFLPDLYWEHYTKNKKLQVSGIDHPKDLSGMLLSNFMDHYISENKNHSDITLVNNYVQWHSSMPADVQSRCYRIDFRDIMTNMDKVLSVISQFTGKEVTPNIQESYYKYIMHQNLPQNFMEALYGPLRKQLHFKT